MTCQKDIFIKKKLIGSSSAKMTNVIAVSKAQNINMQYVNKSKLHQYIFHDKET